MDTQVSGNNSKMSAIDRALAAAKARKAAREGQATELEGKQIPAPVKEVLDKTARRVDRESKLAAIQESKAAEKAAKAQARAAKKAAKLESSSVNKGPTHLKKVEKVKARLPRLDSTTELTFNELTTTLDAQQLQTLVLHLQVHNRHMATIRSTSCKPHPIGTSVRIVSGDPKFIGMVGTVVHSHKLRAKIEVPGQKKLVYIYSIEAEPYVEETAAVG